MRRRRLRLMRSCQSAAVKHRLDHANQALQLEIAGRERAESSGRGLERFFQATLDSLDDHICVVDSDGSILNVNRAWRRFADRNGATSESMSEQANYLAVCSTARGDDEASAHAFGQSLEAVLSGDLETFTSVYPCHSPDQQSWFQARVSRMDGEGPVRATISHHNVTQRTLAEQAHLVEAGRRQLLFDTALDGKVLLDETLRIVDANASFWRMLGYGEAGVPVPRPQDWGGVCAAPPAFFEQWPVSAHTSGVVEASMRRRDGSMLPVEIRQNSVRWGETQLLLCIVRDIEQRVKSQLALAQSVTRYETLLGTLADGVIVIDSEGRIVELNRAACRIFGYEAEEAIGMSLERLMPEQHRGRHAGYVHHFLTTGIAKIIGIGRELEGLRRDGTLFPLDIAVSEIRFGDQRLFAGVVRDITERRSQQKRVLRMTRTRALLGGFANLASHAGTNAELFRSGCRLAIDPGGYLLAWIGLLDSRSGQLKLSSGAGRGLDEYEAARASMSEDASTPLTHLPMRIAHRLTAPDAIPAAWHQGALSIGAASAIELPLTSEGRLVGVLRLFSAEPDAFDPEEVALLEELAGELSHGIEFIARREQLEHLASFDSLTRLSNRSRFLARLADRLPSVAASSEKLILAMLDVENFKGINDTIGRAGGDAILCLLATRISGLVASPEQVCRISADQFALWLPGAAHGEDDASMLQTRILAPMASPLSWEGQSFRLRLRAGVAFYPHDGLDAEALLRDAEAALKRARTSHERLVFSTTQLSSSFRERMRLENELQLALERGEFRLHYQPKVLLDNGLICGCEALLRWERPGLPAISPAVFIPLLEQSGLIVEVGLWALREAAADLTRWQQRGMDLRVAVNVSQVQLKQADFVYSVECAVPAGIGIDLEVTESMLMSDIDETIAKLNLLRQRGMQVSIDDFGTGFSSLSYLARLPIDALKIDQSFVSQLESSRPTLSIVTAMISMSHTLNLKVIAEGVETASQLSLLRSLGCDQVQGWLFSKAVPAEDFERLVVEGRRLPV